ncbi:MAG TPA: hypothetical protein PLW02_08945 [Verrucomicrobiota bacterium]|nr:hypothetical protein [Verrucomicrobiota bacterium]
MNILYLSIALHHLSQKSAFGDLAKEFIKNGHNVKIVAPMVSESIEGVNIEDGIEVFRFKTDQLIGNTSMIKKGLAYMKLIYQYPKAINKYCSGHKIDLIISHSLPPEIGIIVKRLKKKYNAKFYLMLCEYIWQDSVSLGFFKKNSLICKYYQHLEKTNIKTADYIGCPSQGNIDFVLKLYPWAINKNIHILHYSQSPIELSNTNQKKEEIRAKYNLNNKFLAIYGGTLGIAQKIEYILDLAESCLDYENIVFILLGKGSAYNAIKQEVNNRKLNNILLTILI